MQIRVSVSRDFLELVKVNIRSHRPSLRVDASEVDILSDSALVISDHSIFTGKA